jgi:hypothetical protein
MARFILTIVAVVVVVGIVLAAAGILRFQNTEDQSTITIDKKELKAETQDLIKKTEEASGKALDKAGEGLHHAAHELQSSTPDQPTTPATSAPGGKNARRPNDHASPAKQQQI